MTRIWVLLVLLATPLLAQDSKSSKAPSIHEVEVREPRGQILSYRYLGGSTEVVMRGTKLAPDVRVRLKIGSRPGFVELDINRGQIAGLKPPYQFGSDFLTYVLWAVSVDGKASNLGEITFENDRPVSVNVTTPYQTFWLMLTAEPSYAVVDPSRMVVAYSYEETSGSVDKVAQKVPGRLFFYTHYDSYNNTPATPPKAPNALLQARKAVELAGETGMLRQKPQGAINEEEKRARETLSQAEGFLEMAEHAYMRDPAGSDVAQFSRTSAQIAENARALAQGAVGGALIRQLHNEAEQLRSELATLQDTEVASVVEEAAPVPVMAETPSEEVAPETAVQPPPPLRTTVVAAMTKPSTWFAITGWALALLLLFRRRSV